MGQAEIHLVDENDEIEHQFRSVMRRLAGGPSSSSPPGAVTTLQA